MTLAQLDIFNPSILNYAERFINKYAEPNSFDRTSNLNDSFENGFYSVGNLIKLLSSLDLIKMTEERESNYICRGQMFNSYAKTCIKWN